MKNILALLILSKIILVQADNWVPEVKFKLESSDYIQTLNWISGMSYSLSKYHVLLESKGNSELFCNAPKSIGSKQLLEILNSIHFSLTITAEQATETIFKSLQMAYPCK